ncbi:hypothetical protein [Streptomyces sp. MB09-02B]|uniref:hypothetical protein n=1 Tax=Streptomyces sp. MB09-02B TaxID=3028667 RepID=UPI0029AE5C86|nr:hypothetical protein [Streptomyces sp. MB09-02B]MDX3641556.1 hypothetical protein [Streptomyces sp. MB09-02B]
MTELTVVDTWFVAGMAGTGSNTVETGGEIFVPAHRTVPFGGVLSGRTQSESSRQSVPQRENFVVSAVHMVGAPVIGMARAALDVTLERPSTPKPVAYTFYADTRDAPSTQLNIAKAATLIDTAEMLLQWWADETVGAASEGRELDALARTRFRANFGYAMECCRDATKLLLNVQGASAFATTNPVQRIWRDLETASRHGLLNYEFGQELYSHSLLGIEEPIGVLVQRSEP